MQFIALLQVILSLLPLIIQAIKIVEEAFNGSGLGATKLEFVKGVVKDTYENAEDPPFDFDTVWRVVEKLVGKIVGVFNIVGVFTK